MRRLLLVCVVPIACSAADFDYRKQAGVVAARAGEVCLQIDNSALQPGARVDLVLMEARQSVLRAEVVRKREKPCSDADSGDSYQLRRIDGQPGMPADAIAIAGFGGSVEVTGKDAAADLDGDGRKEFFRSCASHEGIHFTIWTGKPLEGALRFHAYHYAGYDLEPNCTAPEYGLAPAGP
jgi:hypothetical protein